MSAPAPKFWTLAEFMDWVEQQPERWEFDGFVPQLMDGGTLAHDSISINVAAAFAARLRGSGCRPHGSNALVVANGRGYYPDVSISCSATPPTERIVRDPVVIVEVLSDSTARIDRNEKLANYHAVPSIVQVVLIDSRALRVEVYGRGAAGWDGPAVIDDAAGSVTFAVAGPVPLTEIYEWTGLL
jgi:Uma2 family endonuclease